MAEAKNEKGAKPGKGDKAAAKGDKAPAAKGGKGAPAPAEAKGGKAPRGSGRGRGRRGQGPAEGLCRAPEESLPRRDRAEAGQAEFGYKNPMQVPKIDKIVLNMGVGEAVNDTKKVTSAAADLALIAGQKPVVTRARKAISTFKVRENMPIGAKVTLRQTRMYEFLDRLVTVALPRVRDFRGLDPKSFDGRGNYALGVKEHIIFPEIDYDKAEAMLGLDIVVCTTAKTDAEARALLRAFNFPFRQ